VAQHNHRKVRFHTEVWAEFIDEEMARLFREGNFTFLEVGLQTTDDTVLASVERRLKLKQFIEGISHLKKFDLRFELQLIYGLPGETRASFKRSLDFAASLEPPRLEVYPLMVLPGTELWRKAETLSLNFDPEPPYRIRSHPSMSVSDVDYGDKVAQAVSFPGNSLAFRLLYKKSRLKFSDMLDEWIAWHDIHAVRKSKEEQINEFLREFCARRAIPDAFFRSLASLEFKVEPLLRAQPAMAWAAICPQKVNVAEIFPVFYRNPKITLFVLFFRPKVTPLIYTSSRPATVAHQGIGEAAVSWVAARQQFQGSSVWIQWKACATATGMSLQGRYAME
jgi:hypothetical protein